MKRTKIKVTNPPLFTTGHWSQLCIVNIKRMSSSVVTLDLGHDPAKKVVPLSQAKLEQLKVARARSLESRRRTQAAKLQGKLTHLRSMLGSDFRNDTVERVAKEMIAHEDRNANEVARLREKHVSAVQDFKEAVTGFRDELKALRKAVGGKVDRASSVLSVGSVKSYL